MSKKGTTNYERELSQQELELLETQNQMMQQSVNIAQQAEDRSQDQYRQWQATYEPIETGMIPQGATRETGYYAPQQAQSNTTNPTLFQRTPSWLGAANVANTIFQTQQGLAQNAKTRPNGRPTFLPTSGKGA